MKNGNEYTIKFSKQVELDKLNIKSAGLETNCKNILILMSKNSFIYPPTYEKLSDDLKRLYGRKN